jgi:hypothetical protein
MGKQVAYYAHAMGYYGSESERRVHALLRDMGYEVECPNQPHHEEGFISQGMAYFDTLIPRLDVIAFEPFPDGKVGAGVAYEVMAMRAVGKPELSIKHRIVPRDAFLIPGRPDLPLDALSREETRARNRALRGW